MVLQNPFIYGNPVRNDAFLGRRKEFRRLGSRIMGRQSTALVGEPRCGKTSLLLHLSNPEYKDNFYGEHAKKLFFSYMDAHTIGDQVTQNSFWELALQPIYDELITPNPDYPISESYRVCKSNDFRSHVLESFLNHLNNDNYQLVILLDEFDMLLHHPVLNSAEFFGSLRSLATRIQSLTIITASRQSLTKLNSATQAFNYTGSPYFNFFSELNLGPMSLQAIDALLERGKEYFSTQDQHFIKHAAGAHPYLLQSAAGALWEIYLDDEHEDAEERLKQAGKQLYDVTNLMLSSTWQIWEPEMRMAIAVIALSQAPDLIDRKFNMQEILHDLRDFGPELRQLENQGFIKENLDSETGWVIRPSVFVWWITDQLIRTVRDKKGFEEWIRVQEWDGLLTKGQKADLIEIGNYISDSFKGSANLLVSSMIKKFI